MSAVYRYEVPVDGSVHTFKLAGGDSIKVGLRKEGVVEFWAVYNEDVGEQERAFTVVGTGHELPADTIKVWGYAYDGHGSLVWHLVEVVSSGQNSD